MTHYSPYKPIHAHVMAPHPSQVQHRLRLKIPLSMPRAASDLQPQRYFCLRSSQPWQRWARAQTDGWKANSTSRCRLERVQGLCHMTLPLVARSTRVRLASRILPSVARCLPQSVRRPLETSFSETLVWKHLVNLQQLFAHSFCRNTAEI